MALVYIGMTVFFTVVSQLLIKLGVTELGRNPVDESGFLGFAAFVVRALLNWKVVLGLGSAFGAAVCWIPAVSRSKISFAYPFTALSIVLVLALSPAIFGEHVPLMRWAGVVVVCFGLWIAAQG